MRTAFKEVEITKNSLLAPRIQALQELEEAASLIPGGQTSVEAAEITS